VSPLTAPRAPLALRALVLFTGILPWAASAVGGAHPEARALFQALCHQRPERTLWFRGAPMVVCSRCAGLYLGLALGALVPLPAGWLQRGRVIVLGALLGTCLEVLAQDLGMHPPWHPTRVLSGLALGWAASGFLSAALRRTEALPPV
jgi:uncharacterized membrane protein